MIAFEELSFGEKIKKLADTSFKNNPSLFLRKFWTDPVLENLENSYPSFIKETWITISKFGRRLFFKLDLKMEAVQPAENNGKNEAWLDTLHGSYINQFQFDSWFLVLSRSIVQAENTTFCVLKVSDQDRECQIRASINTQCHIQMYFATI